MDSHLIFIIKFSIRFCFFFGVAVLDPFLDISIKKINQTVNFIKNGDNLLKLLSLNHWKFSLIHLILYILFLYLSFSQETHRRRSLPSPITTFFSSISPPLAASSSLLSSTFTQTPLTQNSQI